MGTINNNFLSGLMNKDLDERLVPDNSYRDALNIDIDISEGSNAGSAQNKLGNTKIGDLEAITGFDPVAANARTIGATTNERDNVIYWLIASDDFDGVYEFSEETGNIVRVMQCNKLTPSTPSKLNFSKDYIVTGFNFVNGFLYWTDNYNPPRKINIARAKSYSVDDYRIDDDIDVILEPPLTSPTVKLSNDIDKPNNIEEKFVYFAYRYKYVDNQYSSLSPFSAVSFNPKDFELDFAAGNNKSMVNKFNTATVTFKTGNRNVKEIQLIMRDTRNINASLVETFNKEDLNIADNSFYSFPFNNNKTYTIITPDQITRLFDNVPLTAKAQDFVGNRIMYGNYTQFQNIDEPINLNLNYTSVDNIPSPPDYNDNAPIQTFKSDRDYEVAIVYLDKYGRMTTPLTSENNTTYIPPTKSNKGNSLQLEIKNNPPSWATNYRIYIKQSKGNYYNIFPLYMYVSGEYRYFLINESDRDKIPVGDYLIFKSVSNGPTFSNKKYKVLELKPQIANFEGIQGAQAGLYFKVKADSNSDLSQSGLLLWYEDSFSRDNYGLSYGEVTSNGNQLAITNNGFPYIEYPIYYGDNNDVLSLVSTSSSSQNDYRITIKADSATTFIWTSSVNGSTGWSSPISITLNTPIQIGIHFQVKFNAYPVLNDVWKVNIRGVDTSEITDYFGGTGMFGEYPYLILAPDVNNDLEILPGDIITISVHQEPNNTFSYSKTFYANSKYKNIEEWFVESGEYLNFDTQVAVNSGNISFRRGIYNQGQLIFDRLFQPNNVWQYPVFMVIRMQDAPGSNFNRASGSFSIKRSKNIIIAETAPKETDIDIYHELSKTFNIYEGKHLTRWSYKDYTYNSQGTNLGQLVPGSPPTAGEFPHGFEVDDDIFVSSGNINGPYKVVDVIDQYNIVINLPFPGSGPAIPGTVSYNSFDVNQTNANSAKIQINNVNIDNSDFNAWSYRNALETYRIRDDFNKPTLEYSLRAMATVDEYKKKSSKNSICYSGTYGENTNINRLNEFNLSNANFKYLDSEYGSIQKLYARNTNLVVFQEDKVSEVLYGKNLLSDSAGGGAVVSIQEVLGSQVAYPGEWGIGLNPESFAVYATDIYFTDAKRGLVLNMKGEMIEPISDNWMTDYFRDLMLASQNTQKLGAYDPHNNLYTLSSNDTSILACKLGINRTSKVIPYNTNGSLVDLFTITTDNAWEIELVDIGWGTNWVSGFTANGFGSQDIDANVTTNTSLALRKVVFNVKYCTNKNIAFMLIQSGYSNITVVTGIFNRKE